MATDCIPALWMAIGSSLLCSLLTGICVHYLTKDRDAQTRRVIQEREADIRRRGFKRHLLRIRYTLERTPHDKPDEVWSVYTKMAPDLLADAALVDGDFQPSATFTTLVRRAGEWRREDAEKEAHSSGTKVLRDVLRDSICDVYDFTTQK